MGHLRSATVLANVRALGALMYSTQPNGADSGTINPAALNTAGKLFRPFLDMSFPPLLRAASFICASRSILISSWLFAIRIDRPLGLSDVKCLFAHAPPMASLADPFAVATALSLAARDQPC